MKKKILIFLFVLISILDKTQNITSIIINPINDFLFEISNLGINISKFAYDQNSYWIDNSSNYIGGSVNSDIEMQSTTVMYNE